jgi:hypothetical protein
LENKMPPRQKRAGDLTGIRTEALQKEHAEELAEKSRQMTMIQAVADAERLEPVDLTGPERTEQVDGVEVKKAKMRVRSLATFDATVGRGNNFSLEEGRTYDLPAHVAEHFLSKGLVWA